MNAEIIAVGSEMLTPFRQDTNSLYITEKLNELGVAVDFKTIAGDRLKHLADAVRHALSRVDLLVISGGLGPTEDDLTREAVAEALGVRVKRDPELIAHLYARAAARRMTITRNNEKQADVIEGATMLPNQLGSAPGQWLDTVVGKHRKLAHAAAGSSARAESDVRGTVPAAFAGDCAEEAHCHACTEGGDDRRVDRGREDCPDLYPIQGR